MGKDGLCYYDDETEYMYQQHRDIVDAIKAGDETQAVTRMETHLNYVESLLNRLIAGETSSKAAS